MNLLRSPSSESFISVTYKEADRESPLLRSIVTATTIHPDLVKKLVTVLKIISRLFPKFSSGIQSTLEELNLNATTNYHIADSIANALTTNPVDRGQLQPFLEDFIRQSFLEKTIVQDRTVKNSYLFSKDSFFHNSTLESFTFSIKSSPLVGTLQKGPYALWSTKGNFDPTTPFQPILGYSSQSRQPIQLSVLPKVNAWISRQFQAVSWVQLENLFTVGLKWHKVENRPLGGVPLTDTLSKKIISKFPESAEKHEFSYEEWRALRIGLTLRTTNFIKTNDDKFYVPSAPMANKPSEGTHLYTLGPVCAHTDPNWKWHGNLKLIIKVPNGVMYVKMWKYHRREPEFHSEIRLSAGRWKVTRVEMHDRHSETWHLEYTPFSCVSELQQAGRAEVVNVETGNFDLVKVETGVPSMAESANRYI